LAKRSIAPIENERIRLRLLEKEDLSLILGWRNQDHVRTRFIHSEIIRPEQHENWFEQYLQRDDDYLFVIEEIRYLRKPVGQVSIYKIDWERKRAEFGRLLIGEKDAAGKGIASAATNLILDFAFKTLQLDEIELLVKSDNEEAIRIYQDCGFREVQESEGLKKMLISNER
jgi:RimJ/RimL family protein N-acetyltransferase